MQIAKEIFRAYDIRGVVERTLTKEAVFNIGRAVASKVLAAGGKQIVVGRDGRLSGPMLIEQFIAGAIATGCDIVNIGQVATPVLYFATKYLQIPAAIMLTGSHNPPDYNGIKIILADRAIYGDDIIELYNIIQAGKFPSGNGQVISQNITQEYISYIVNKVQLAKPLRVVVDSGSGVCGDIAPALYRAMGCEVIPLFCKVDGTFPHHHPDPGDPNNLAALIAAVKTEQADIGFGYDGDGDRLGVIDSSGKIIWPDRVLMLFAKDLLPRNPGASIIYDIKSSCDLKAVIHDSGGVPILYKTGHSLIKAKMQETKAVLAGEMSGHIFFKERWFGFDDAMYAGARLLEILANTTESSAAIFAKLPEKISTPEIAIEVTEATKFAIIEQLITKANFPEAIDLITIDGLRVEFTDGWGLIRASNTTPKLILRFEANDLARLQAIQQVFKENLLQLAPNLVLPF